MRSWHQRETFAYLKDKHATSENDVSLLFGASTFDEETRGCYLEIGQEKLVVYMLPKLPLKLGEHGGVFIDMFLIHIP